MSDIGLTPTELVCIMVSGGFGFVVLFAAIGSAIIRRDIDEQRARRELLQAQDREERLTPIAIRRVERPEHVSARTHLREPRLLPSRRGDA